MTVTSNHSDILDDDEPLNAESVMPSLDALKAKYLGVSRPDSLTDRMDDLASGAAESADTTLVELESGPLKKTVAVSKSRKKVIWSQG